MSAQAPSSGQSSGGASRRGGPIAVIGVLLGVWIMGRAVLWESPFGADGFQLPAGDIFLAEQGAPPNAAPGGQSLPPENGGDAGANMAFAGLGNAGQAQGGAYLLAANLTRFAEAQSSRAIGTRPMIAAGHRFLMAAAFQVDWANPDNSSNPVGGGFSQAASAPARTGFGGLAGPFLPPGGAAGGGEADRWALDAFAFFRAGSGSTSISQGRVPVYGASQVAANLQYRMAPGSRHDPRAYVRGYRAFVPDPENEAAAGLSARPYGPVPVRVAAELRVTNNAFGTDVRPAVYAVTELPVVDLPFDLRMEAYGGAGYVGGRADTAFADGQANITREVVRFNQPSDRDIRISLGGGAWGGAQKDASRLDVGPSVRVDLTVGAVPARLSVDWRERVAGDAAPESGIAATLSTRF